MSAGRHTKLRARHSSNNLDERLTVRPYRFGGIYLMLGFVEKLGVTGGVARVVCLFICGPSKNA
jgi:hypothetical protein